MPYFRKELLFDIQKRIEHGFTDVLNMSRQEAINKQISARIHSSHDEKNLYIQFQLGEKKGENTDRGKLPSWTYSISPQLLVELAKQSKKVIEELRKRPVYGFGELRRCSDDSEHVALE